jgi:hypothetical protein
MKALIGKITGKDNEKRCACPYNAPVESVSQEMAPPVNSQRDKSIPNKVCHNVP